MTGDETLWNFSLRFYARPGVASACLALQNEDEVDVNLLLFAAWMGYCRGVRLSFEEAGAARSAVTEWQANIVRPLRAVRMLLADPFRSIEDSARTALRGHVKEVELDAERLEQAALQRLASALPRPLERAASSGLAELNIRAMLTSPLSARAEGDILVLSRALAEMDPS